MPHVGGLGHREPTQEEIGDRIRETKLRMEKARIEYDLEMRGLKDTLKHLQQKCHHPKTEFEADPAGDSSESYHECLVCGLRF